MKTLSHIILGFAVLITPLSLSSQTIREKKEGLCGGSDLDPQSQELLNKVNQELTQKQQELHRLYAETEQLYACQAPEASYQQLLQRINEIKMSMDQLDHEWREKIRQGHQEENYGLWYQPDTTIEQLVIDYGASDYVYLMSPEVSAMKLSVASNLPIPRASWNEMLELILTQNGVGIKQINPYLRELYFLAENQSAVKLVTNRKQDLECFPANTRICYVLTPEPAEVRRIWFFLDKFVNHQSTTVQLVGREILVIGSVVEIQDLLKLYDFAANNRGDKEYRLVSLSRINAEEMAKILGALFDQIVDYERRHPENPLVQMPEIEHAESNGLKVIVLANVAQALFLIGTEEEIDKAEEIICEVDGQIGDVREKVIYWYKAKNSDAEEIAEVLYKIYNLMVKEKIGIAIPGQGPFPRPDLAGNGPIPVPPIPGISPDAGAPLANVVPIKTPEVLYHDSFYQDGNVAVNPAPVTLVPPPVEFTDSNRHNFIVDVKTNSIVMVVEPEILPKLKELLRKLDVPKKMVQIDVLLFEKRITDSTNYGLNLLRIGSAASQTHKTSFTFNDLLPVHGVHDLFNKGITAFMMSRPKEHGLPAFDFTYKFLLSQEDVQINASPSIVTMNQTPAKLAIVEEFSINTGIFEVETAKGTTLKDAFTRAQYGITLEITPTIHMADDEDEEGFVCPDGDIDYITLSTNVNFDTVQSQPHPGQHDRPCVTRRNIVNEVLIPDGQTVILGGLRRKNTHDCKESIPFIGELPGIGKLFSNTAMHDNSTEMFIFITPKIISDPIEDLDRIRREELSLRPGDTPEFLCNLVEAREIEKNRLLAGTMRILFGRTPDRCYGPVGEYDGQ